jgi:hypothetical protein
VFLDRPGGDVWLGLVMNDLIEVFAVCHLHTEFAQNRLARR